MGIIFEYLVLTKLGYSAPAKPEKQQGYHKPSPYSHLSNTERRAKEKRDEKQEGGLFAVFGIILLVLLIVLCNYSP